MTDRLLNPWIKRFLISYLPQHRGVSPHTILSYAQALRDFHHYLTRVKRKRSPAFTHITAENVLGFLAELESRRGNGSATRNARLAAIFSFLRFAFLMNRIDKEPYERIRQIAFKRTPFRPSDYLEPQELEAIFRSVCYRTREGFRDLTLLKLLYNIGARASEVATMKISGLDLSNSRVAIMGKGRKQRLCSIWETTATLIKIYLSSERYIPLKGYEDFLFISRRHRPLTRHGVWDIVQRHADKAAKSCPSLEKKRITPHTFRHTTGMHLVEAGVDINTIREWLGHEHISTTEVYARANLRLKRIALDKLQEFDWRLLRDISAERQASNVPSGIGRWIEKL